MFGSSIAVIIERLKGFVEVYCMCTSSFESVAFHVFECPLVDLLGVCFLGRGRCGCVKRSSNLDPTTVDRVAYHGGPLTQRA